MSLVSWNDGHKFGDMKNLTRSIRPRETKGTERETTGSVTLDMRILLYLFLDIV